MARSPRTLSLKNLGSKNLCQHTWIQLLQFKTSLQGLVLPLDVWGFDPITAASMGVKSLTGQLEPFEEYKQRLNAAVGAERASIIVSESMYFVVTGTDDFTTSYYNLPFRRPWYNTSAYIDLLINHASSFLQSLYDKGARRIGVLNMPPTGCLPSQRTEFRGLLRHCVEGYNAAAILFNSKLLSLIHFLNSKFPDARFVYLDLYHPLLHLINNPHQSGFTIANKGCCGIGELAVAVLCNHLDRTCNNDSSYIFWDSFHPTQAACKLLVHLILRKSIKDFF